SITEYKEEYAIEDDEQNAKNLLKQSCEKSKGHLWLRYINSNFKPLEKMIVDIETLENRYIQPRTSKDFNYNTLYWD
ncbi:3123_t:CDS:2, partial [Gigaspora rosea]